MLTRPSEGVTQLNYLMLQYVYLQMLDFLTTIAFLANGVREANPVVNIFMRMGSTPVGGLLLVKLLAVALGIFCWRMGRNRLLGRVNMLFALLVMWNLVALIVGRISA